MQYMQIPHFGNINKLIFANYLAKLTISYKRSLFLEEKKKVKIEKYVYRPTAFFREAADS